MTGNLMLALSCAGNCLESRSRCETKRWRAHSVFQARPSAFNMDWQFTNAHSGRVIGCHSQRRGAPGQTDFSDAAGIRTRSAQGQDARSYG